MDNTELLARLLTSWTIKTMLNKEEGNFVTVDYEDPISEIIYRRTKYFNVKVPAELGFIISICSNGNPGMAIIMYYTMLESVVKKNGLLPRDGYVIKPMDFSISFPESFPDITNETQRQKFEKLWDDQKDENGRNKVDTHEYWAQLFEEDKNE